MAMAFIEFFFISISEFCYEVFSLVVIIWYRAGFWSAMASNVTFQSRNVLSKKLMVKKEVIKMSRFAS